MALDPLIQLLLLLSSSAALLPVKLVQVVPLRALLNGSPVLQRAVEPVEGVLLGSSLPKPALVWDSIWEPAVLPIKVALRLGSWLDGRQLISLSLHCKPVLLLST